ncbi:MAG TPA: DUF58 domain-containing protein [Acidobacteriota bacterium]|nr:DUF58 domain-containing protein [Acidobacteriota bacterium]
MANDTRSHARPGSRFIDPLVLGRIDNLDLLARTVVEGFIGGLHRSPYRGLSVDFAEHRAYMPGDDIRMIDWRVFGRTDRFYIKQFEADSNANFTVMLDVSRSMGFAQSGISKLDYARYLAACLIYFAGKQRDRIGFLSFNDDVVDYVPPAAKHLDLILHTIDRIEPGGASTLERPMWKLAEAARRRGIMVLISDLYEDPGMVLESVQRLGYKGNDLLVFHVLDRAEIDFPFDESANYVDMESGESLPVIPDRLRERYQELVAEHIQALQNTLGQRRIDYALFDTSQPLDHALFRYLSMRHQLTRVR